MNNLTQALTTIAKAVHSKGEAIGNLDELSTEAKTSLVAALNELKTALDSKSEQSEITALKERLNQLETYTGIAQKDNLETLVTNALNGTE